MDYFVSIENTPYFHWQTDLLIESFKKHNLEDNLLIAIASNEDAKAIPDFTFNLSKHKRIFLHPSYTEEHGHPCFNKIFSLISALENKILSNPFVMIHPDMLLMKPMSEEIEKEKDDDGNDVEFNICFGTDIDEALHVKEFIEPLAKEIVKARGFPDENFSWIPLGNVVKFYDVPISFFYRMAQRTRQLIEDQKENTSFDFEKGGWLLALYDYMGRLMYRGEFYEITMLHHDLTTNFIHYKHGLPPAFSKQQFVMREPIGFIASGGDPFEVLAELDEVTSTVKYMKNVVNSYMAAKT